MFNTTNHLLVLILLISAPLFQQKCLVSGSPVLQRSFKRPDPLRHFKDYNGGFDIRDKHYVASTAFTGVHGVASSFVLTTSNRTLMRTEKLKETVLGIGEDALGTIGRVMKTTKQMQYILLPYNPQICATLSSITQDLRRNSRVIRRFVDSSRQAFNKATHTLYIAHVVVLSVNFVTLVASLVLLLLHWRPGFIMIIFCFWILTSMCWFLTGLDFFLYNFAGDACFAFEDFQQHPLNSSLGSMLPCINESFSEKLLAEIGYTINNFIVELNSNMSVLYRLLGVGEKNEEIMGVIKICDPFSGAPNYSYIPQNCPHDAIKIGDVSKILARFTCHKEATTKECKDEGKFLPEGSYNMAHAYSRSIQDLLDIYPDLLSLSKCTIVKNKVAEIVEHQCRPIRISTTLLWSCMLFLSSIMVFLVLTWIAEAFLCCQKNPVYVFQDTLI